METMRDGLNALVLGVDALDRQPPVDLEPKTIRDDLIGVVQRERNFPRWVAAIFVDLMALEAGLAFQRLRAKREAARQRAIDEALDEVCADNHCPECGEFESECVCDEADAAEGGAR